MTNLVRLLVESAPTITWAAIFLAAIIGIFAVYVGIALVGILRATDPEQMRIRYRVFQDLLRLFQRKRK